MARMIYILSAWCDAAVSAPRLWSVVLRLHVTYIDLKICLVNDGETGVWELRSTSLIIQPCYLTWLWAWIRRGKVEFKAHSLNLDTSEPPVDAAIILPPSHKRKLHYTLFNYMTEHETDPMINDQ
jgi:hypothetical protein